MMRITSVPRGILKNVSWALGLALLVSLPAQGHHSAAMFDNSVELTMTGEVARFEYVAPHSWLYVNVENEDGTSTMWGFELGAATILRSSGISPNFWQPGDRVSVKTNPLRDGRPAGNLRGAVAANGRTFGNTDGLDQPE